MALASAKGKLIGVIGDEVKKSIPKQNLNNLSFFQDTCVGFLLGGIGEINKNRQPNFLVVDKSE